MKSNYLTSLLSCTFTITLFIFSQTSLHAITDTSYFNSSNPNGKKYGITISAPDIAENGAVVPITISTTLSNVENISVFVDKNPQPLAANFDLTSNVSGFVSTRIKMRETSDVIAIIKSGGKLYKANKTVKVTIGGCGG